MQWCRQHAEKLIETRADLGLTTAPLAIEYTGIDIFDRRIDGPRCEICVLNAHYCAEESEDRKFLVRIWTSRDIQRVLFDGKNTTGLQELL